MPNIIDQDRWGICGFVSVLNGLRKAGLLTKMTDTGEEKMDLKEIQTRLYAEIVTYLKYLLFTESPLVAQIQEISYALAPKGTPKRSLRQIIDFIEGRLRKIAKQKDQRESSIRGMMRTLITGEHENNITVAMTPDALLDYMKWVGLKNAQDLKVLTTMNNGQNLLAHKNCILGLGEKQGPGVLYNGLEHWIYIDDEGVLQNWGEKTTLKAGDLGTTLFGKWAIYITHVIKMG
jgi:hypothetical protein